MFKKQQHGNTIKEAGRHCRTPVTASSSLADCNFVIYGFVEHANAVIITACTVVQAVVRQWPK